MKISAEQLSEYANKMMIEAEIKYGSNERAMLNLPGKRCLSELEGILLKDGCRVTEISIKNSGCLQLEDLSYMSELPLPQLRSLEMEGKFRGDLDLRILKNPEMKRLSVNGVDHAILKDKMGPGPHGTVYFTVRY